jgi:hypothetical protein
MRHQPDEYPRMFEKLLNALRERVSVFFEKARRGVPEGDQIPDRARHRFPMRSETQVSTRNKMQVFQRGM